VQLQKTEVRQSHKTRDKHSRVYKIKKKTRRNEEEQDNSNNHQDEEKKKSKENHMGQSNLFLKKQKTKITRTPQLLAILCAESSGSWHGEKQNV
jgi:hypothetical protein